MNQPLQARATGRVVEVHSSRSTSSLARSEGADPPLARVDVNSHRTRGSLVVSVIVPCYNSAKFVASTIESILQQELSEWELILVDDGSEDATWQFIQSYTHIDPRIRGFRKDNGGTGEARNHGFDKADPSARYLFFLDHDDQLEPNALSLMASYLDAHPDVGLLGCQLQDISAEGNRLGTRKRSRWAPGFFFPHELQDTEVETPFVTFFCGTGQGPFAMYRRSTYLQTEGWETKFWPHEDTDMFCQMALLSKVHFLADRLYLKRIHPAQGMSDESRVQEAYPLFRAKWDNRPAKNDDEAVLLREARKYYYSMHRPCRHLKVAHKALREFLADGDWARLRWSARLVAAALKEFLFSRIDLATQPIVKMLDLLWRKFKQVTKRTVAIVGRCGEIAAVQK